MDVDCALFASHAHWRLWLLKFKGSSKHDFLLIQFYCKNFKVK